MSYQKTFAEELHAAESELKTLPQPCIHQDLLEEHRHTTYGIGRKARSVECPACHQVVIDETPLRASDAPALVHAIINFGTFFLINKLFATSRMQSDVAMWIAWLTVFVYNFVTRTPVRAARNAILILFAIDTVMIYALFWPWLMTLTYSQLALRAVNSFIAALIGTSPIFVSFGIHSLIRRLKTKASAET